MYIIVIIMCYYPYYIIVSNEINYVNNRLNEKEKHTRVKSSCPIRMESTLPMLEVFDHKETLFAHYWLIAILNYLKLQKALLIKSWNKLLILS